MNADKLVADLREIEEDYEGGESEGEDPLMPTQKVTFPSGSVNRKLFDEKMNHHYTIFNTKNEFRKTEINVEKTQIEIINHYIFLLKLLRRRKDEEIIREIAKCIEVTFETDNDEMQQLSEEKSFHMYKQYLLKNKYFFLKIWRSMKNKNFYPDVKQIIKDTTRDVFSFNRQIHNGSLGFKSILSNLYKLLGKYFQCDFRKTLLAFFLLSLMSRTNNTVDILYTLEYYFKNKNFSIILPNSSFISPCELSICNNIILLRSHVKYFIKITEESSSLLPYNCYNIIYIDENLISDNFYLHIYKTLLKDCKHHYLFRDNELFGQVNFFDVKSNCAKLKSKGVCKPGDPSRQIPTSYDATIHPNGEKTESIEQQGDNFATLLDDVEVSSSSTYNCSDNEIDIKNINEKNRLYRDNIRDHLGKRRRNFFYQYLIIELSS
ncbi:Uncharacterized protein PCOAH_00017400 [Plasmodium coatneyi]|uniref:Uncharacterized protein n=1 Tax=Plasmodium coatneyi TaxID=208452 RepID=A0A1B1DX75_9APIC|nr:Uncharacterized protein PCOAH_00017400 [Plasmodium coatneyi]ANQ07382.1 Uncharacterized protein PCOAH_00017400 [Plasmodium coatneyi]